jgi:hypothetical protein
MSVILRPFIVPLKNVLSIAVDTVIMIASFLGAVLIGGNMEEHAAMIEPIQYACALSATIGGGILVCLTVVKFLFTRTFGLSLVPRVEIIRRAGQELRGVTLISMQTSPRDDQEQQQRRNNNNNKFKEDNKKNNSKKEEENSKKENGGIQNKPTR